jgi:exosome complex RNA-binding protein Rrp4
MPTKLTINIDAIRGDDGRIYIEAQSGHMVPVNYMKINLIEDESESTDLERFQEHHANI